jgi:hypothetical protein
VRIVRDRGRLLSCRHEISRGLFWSAAACRRFGLRRPGAGNASLIGSATDNVMEKDGNVLKGLGAKLGLRRCRIPYRSGASLLQPLQAVNDLGVWGSGI